MRQLLILTPSFCQQWPDVPQKTLRRRHSFPISHEQEAHGLEEVQPPLPHNEELVLLLELIRGVTKTSLGDVHRFTWEREETISLESLFMRVSFPLFYVPFEHASEFSYSFICYVNNKHLWETNATNVFLHTLQFKSTRLILIFLFGSRNLHTFSMNYFARSRWMLKLWPSFVHHSKFIFLCGSTPYSSYFFVFYDFFFNLK